MVAKFYWKWDFWNLNILRMKEEKIGIIWKPEFEKKYLQNGVWEII